MARGRSSALKNISSRVRWLPLTIALEEMNSIDTTPTPPIRRTIRRKSRSVTPAVGASQRGGAPRAGAVCPHGGLLSGGGGGGSPVFFFLVLGGGVVSFLLWPAGGCGRG